MTAWAGRTRVLPFYGLRVTLGSAFEHQAQNQQNDTNQDAGVPDGARIPAKNKHSAGRYTQETHVYPDADVYGNEAAILPEVARTHQTHYETIYAKQHPQSPSDDSSERFQLAFVHPEFLSQRTSGCFPCKANPGAYLIQARPRSRFRRPFTACIPGASFLTGNRNRSNRQYELDSIAQNPRLNGETETKDVSNPFCCSFRTLSRKSSPLPRARGEQRRRASQQDRHH